MNHCEPDPACKSHHGTGSIDSGGTTPWCTSVELPCPCTENTIEQWKFRYEELQEQLKEPTCPHCKTKMKPTHYIGYYDEFHYWECKCQKIPNSQEWNGAYA